LITWVRIRTSWSHQQPLPHGALRRTDPIRRAIDAGAVGLGQRRHVAPIRLDPARSRPIHRGEVRVGHDDFVAQLFEAGGDPLAFRTGLQEDAHPGAPAKHRGKLISARDDASLEDHRALRRHNANLAMLRVEIDGTIVHGWLLLCAVSAFVLVERYATTRDQPAASSHLSS
jgi:hypothetical protein